MGVALLGSALVRLGARDVPSADGGNPFIPPATQGMVRRQLAASAVLPVIVGAQQAVAAPRVTDLGVYYNKRKLELVPIFYQGIDYLKRKGIDQRLLTFEPKLTRKMKIYAGMFSQTEAPDATVRRLEKDVDAFQKALTVDQDKEKALAAFEQYRLDIPPGTGRFDLKDKSSWSAPDEPVRE